MLKDNHIWSKGNPYHCPHLPLGSITEAIKAARSVGGFSLKIEVEVQSETEADEAIAAGADIVVLDNVDGPGLRAAASGLRQRWKLDTSEGGLGNKVLLECSGGLTEANVASFLCNGISTRSRYCADSTLDIDIYSTSAIHRNFLRKCG